MSGGRAGFLVRWVAPLAAGVALWLYSATAAPGLTWAHFGADGGDLLAAAVVNGVPHPPGYPLYTMLLQGWLAAGAQIGALAGEPVSVARLGNLFSATCAAIVVGVTAQSAYRMCGAWWAALAAALLWAVSPLFWGQALITEVYTLHMLAVALLGWAMVSARPETAAWVVAPVVAMGTANHLTFLLLLPAAAYALWRRGAGIRSVLAGMGAGIAGGALLYARIPLVAGGGADGPPPVNWGFADNLAGFAWLVGGEAYRGYLFALPLRGAPLRVAAWASTLVEQFTAVGLAVALVGLAYLDRKRPVWRNVGLLWTIPLSVYAIFYDTADSDVYLLPVVWMGALWIAVGLTAIEERATRLPGVRSIPRPALIAGIGATMGIVAVAAALGRASHISLQNDVEAQGYVSLVAAEVEPGSLVVTMRDGETFALWYGAWAAGEAGPLRSARLINPALLEYAWYRRLVRELYPDLAGAGLSFAELIEANRGRVPIYLSEPVAPVEAEELTRAGPLWRLERVMHFEPSR